MGMARIPEAFRHEFLSSPAAVKTGQMMIASRLLGADRTTGKYTEGPSTQDLSLLVPKTIPSMAFGTKRLKFWVLGPSGIRILQDGVFSNPTLIGP